MSQFKSQLNVKEIREFFNPTGSFSRKYKTAADLLTTLRRNDFQICKVATYSHHVTIKLGCGAVLSVYTASGKVMAQGKLKGCGSQEAMQMLGQLLPKNTTWMLQME